MASEAWRFPLHADRQDKGVILLLLLLPPQGVVRELEEALPPQEGGEAPEEALLELEQGPQVGRRGLSHCRHEQAHMAYSLEAQ